MRSFTGRMPFLTSTSRKIPFLQPLWMGHRSSLCRLFDASSSTFHGHKSHE